jgi:hypothetical protein
MVRHLVFFFLLCGIIPPCFGLTANYNADCIVNFEDFAYLASEYRSLATSCVGHWRLNDNEPNTTVLDSSGNGHHGISPKNTEDMYVAGKISGALDFDGSSDYVDVNIPDSFFQDSFTINCYLKPDDGHPSGSKRIMGYTRDVGILYGVYLQLDSTGEVRSSYGSYTDSLIELITPEPVFLDGETEWIMITMIVENVTETTARIKIYADGELKATSDDSWSNMSEFDIDFSFYIGAYNENDVSSGNPFEGLIDNVLIFDKALSQSEIEWLYYNGNGTEYGLGEAVTYDLDSDGDIDIDDIAEFAEQWLEFEQAIEADNISLEINQNSEVYIHLSSESSATYYIQTLPAYGTLYDPDNSDPDYSDPNIDDPNVIEITSVPYTLLDTGDRVIYKSDSDYYGSTNFTYYADINPDIEYCGKSNIATVAIQCVIVPVAYDSAESVETYVVYSFDLSAVDDGTPLPLIYEVNDIAANSKMADTFIGTPILEPNLMPWILRYEGKTVYFITDTVGDSNFMFRVYDGNDWSNYATVQITAAANPMDALYLNGEPNSHITIPDNDYLDIMGPQWACSFWFNNYLRRPYQSLMSKRDSGPGYEISIKAGKVQFDLYDANGLVTNVRSDIIISDGTWYCTDVIYYYDDDPNYGYMNILTYNSDGASVGYTESGSFSHSAFSNNSNLVIEGDFGFDHLRFWNDVNEGLNNFIYHSGNRQNYTETNMGFGNTSNVRYKCDEGNGTTITDNKGNADDGALGDDVIWHPPYYIFRSLVKH